MCQPRVYICPLLLEPPSHLPPYPSPPGCHRAPGWVNLNLMMKNSWEPAFWVFLQWSNLYLLERRKTKSLFFCMCTQSLCISRPYTQYQRHKGRFWLNSIGMILTFRSPHGNDLYIVLGWPKRSFGFFVASYSKPKWTFGPSDTFSNDLTVALSLWCHRRNLRCCDWCFLFPSTALNVCQIVPPVTGRLQLPEVTVSLREMGSGWSWSLDTRREIS